VRPAGQGPELFSTAEDAETAEKTLSRQYNGISRINRIPIISSPLRGRGLRGGWFLYPVLRKN